MSTPIENGSLLGAGFRLVDRGGVINWIHPALMQAGDVDCTEMDDAAFEEHITTGANK